MDRNAVTSAVIAAASEISGLQPRDIVGATTFDQLGLDSLDCLVLVAAVEDSLHVEIGCAERMDLATIDDVVDLVESKTMRLAA